MNFPQSCCRTNVSVLCSISKLSVLLCHLSFPGGGIISGDVPRRFWGAQRSRFPTGARVSVPPSAQHSRDASGQELQMLPDTHSI